MFEGTHGFEPWTYRTAADCSTTELYHQICVMLEENWNTLLTGVDKCVTSLS